MCDPVLHNDKGHRKTIEPRPIASSHAAAGGAITSTNINSRRLLDRLDDLAISGRTAQGGGVRMALYAEDTAARKTVVDWGSSGGFQARMDEIGKLFMRRPGVNPSDEPVLAGSHLDTQV